MKDDWDIWVERYRAHLELEGLAPRTVQGRAWLLAKFVAWCRGMGVLSPAHVTVEILADYRRYRIQYVNARGRKDRAFTVNTHLLALRDFFGILAAKGAVPGQFLGALGYVKEPRLLPKDALKHAEVMKIFERIPGDTPLHLRDRAIVEVLYSTGIRREELTQLALADLDLDGGALRIERGKGGKGRVVPLGKAAAEWLGRYLVAGRPSLLGHRDDPGTVFLSKSGLPLRGQSVREVVRRWARAAGIEKPVSPHTLRRSCATGMIRNRANPGHVKDILGHDDFRSLQAYVNLEIVDLKDAHRRFHPREQGDDDHTSGMATSPG